MFKILNIDGSMKLKPRNTNNQAPFVVILKDKRERNSILKKAKELRDSKEYENVYINPDLTESERFKSKFLREECRKKNKENIENEFYYGIRNEKVTKIKK